MEEYFGICPRCGHYELLKKRSLPHERMTVYLCKHCSDEFNRIITPKIFVNPTIYQKIMHRFIQNAPLIIKIL